MNDKQVQNMKEALLALGMTEDKADAYIAEVKAAGHEESR